MICKCDKVNDKKQRMVLIQDTKRRKEDEQVNHHRKWIRQST